MEENISHGRSASIFIIGLLLLIMIATGIQNMISIGSEAVIYAIIKIVIVIVLCLTFYYGFNFGRISLIIYCLLAILLSLKGIASIFNDLTYGLVSILYFFAYDIIVLLLVKSENIKTYMKYKRGKEI